MGSNVEKSETLFHRSIEINDEIMMLKNDFSEVKNVSEECNSSEIDYRK
jgi:hypothetical protein